MEKMVGYMATWTTYGTRLPGDKRGYVQDGKKWPEDACLEEAARKLQKYESVRFTSEQKRIVEQVILEEAKRIGQEIPAIVVFSNHVHIVVGSVNESIENTVSRYKNKATCALKKTGLTKRVWTRGFNKRFCFNDEQMKQKSEYVNHHNK